VIIESPDHDQRMHEMDSSKLEDLFWAFRDRIMDLKKDPRLEYILIFKNHGIAAGASLAHPHSQLIAMPMVPVRLKQEIAGAKNYFDYKERCVYCDIIRQEIADKARVVVKNDDFIAFAPYASRFPFEIWVLPTHHSSDFQNIQKHEVTNLAGMMRTVLSKHFQVLDNPPYNFILHTAPLKSGNIPYYHWYIEIIPKLTKLAGFEHGTGFYINPTPPEDAAKFLREASLPTGTLREANPR
jgi:UDPglucose--hexose-1-phosphate uridylyltransferase